MQRGALRVPLARRLRLSAFSEENLLQDQRCGTDGLGAGVGLMYFLDPERGHRGRGRVRDRPESAVLSLLVLERNRAEVLRRAA